jgi:16S rRNA (adenine1518-N6/adenine1519-N6)-dimethyltransferase
MQAKKSLGQNFLTSGKALMEIVNAAEVNADDIVLEIGPGKGVLTEKLIHFAGKVVAVEKDDQLYEFMKQKFAKEISEGKLDLINGDILEFDTGVMKFYKDFNFKIVANIPYNITGAIFKKFLSAEFQPETMVLLVQKEVAERIAREKKESILSLSIKAYGEPKYISTVKAGSFVPAPNVDSAVLLIENISKDFFKEISEDSFFRAIKAGFGSKRKKLSSNLSEVYPKDKVLKSFQTLNLDENIRAEDLSLLGWKSLVKLLEKTRKLD